MNELASINVTAPVIDDTSDGPRLRASRCLGCAAVTFPAQASCPRCASEDTETRLLAATGRLWAFTIQGFPPKEPYLAAADPFEPFGVGYVDIDGEVLVESRLVASTAAELEIGMVMELVVVPFATQADGRRACTYAFQPATGTSNGGAR